MVARPIFEDQMPYSHFFKGISLADVEEFVSVGHLFGYFFLHKFFLVEMLLFGLVLFLHFLHPLGIELIEIGQIFEIDLSLEGRLLYLLTLIVLDLLLLAFLLFDLLGIQEFDEVVKIVLHLNFNSIIKII